MITTLLMIIILGVGIGIGLIIASIIFYTLFYGFIVQVLKMEEKYPALQKVYFHKAVESGNTLVILVNKGDVQKILSYGGKILKEISEKTSKKKIRILASNAEPRRFLEDLCAPASILTINKIWLPDGSTETKVVIPKKDERKLPINIEALKEIAKSIQSITLRVEFESHI